MLDSQVQCILQAGHQIQALVVDQAAEFAVDVMQQNGRIENAQSVQQERTAVVVAADNDVLDAHAQGILQAGHHVEVLVVHQAAQVAVHKDAPRGQVHGQIRLQHTHQIEGR